MSKFKNKSSKPKTKSPFSPYSEEFSKNPEGGLDMILQYFSEVFGEESSSNGGIFISKFGDFLSMVRNRDLMERLLAVHNPEKVNRFFDMIRVVVFKVARGSDENSKRLIGTLSDFGAGLRDKNTETFGNILVGIAEDSRHPQDQEEIQDSKLKASSSNEETILTDSLSAPEPTFTNSMLHPVEISALSSVERSCRDIGQRIEVGTFLHDISKLRNVFHHALFYYYRRILKKKVSEINSMGSREKFLFLFNQASQKPSISFVKFALESMSNGLSDRYDLDRAILNLRAAIDEANIGKTRNRADSFNISELIGLMFSSKDALMFLVDPDNTKNLINNGRKILPGEISKILALFRTDQIIDNIGDSKLDDEFCAKSYEQVTGETGNQMRLYWWQKEAVDYAIAMESFILSGPTSGGKTFASMMIMAKIISMINHSRETTSLGEKPLFVYCAPTDPLALQTYSNMIVSFPRIANTIAIVSSSLVNVPINASIFVGTPKHLRDVFIQRDFSILTRQGVPPTERLKQYVETINHRNIASLVVDEVHVLSPSYNSSGDSDIAAKSIEDMIGFLRSNGSIKQFIGLSATLPGDSSNVLREKIESLTSVNGEPGIRPHLLNYKISDIGKYERDDESLSDRPETMPQEPYPVLYDLTVRKLRDDTRPSQIDITPEFIEQLLFKMKEENVLPAAMFFETEVDAIFALRDFMSYIDMKTKSSIWVAMRKEYRMKRNSNIPIDVNDLVRKIHSKISELASSPGHSNRVPLSLIEPLISVYRLKFPTEPLPESINYSPDLYAFLLEIIDYNDGSPLFERTIHPFYDFGGVSESELNRMTIPEIESDFINIMRGQMIDNTTSSTFRDLLIDGLRHGIGMVTSTAPLAFQVQVSRLLKRIKDDPSGKGIGAVFCDGQMSMGVDYPFNSVAIIRKKISPLCPSEFFQMNGRAGRKFQRAITFMVNVENCHGMRNTDTIDFDLSNTLSEYYQPAEIANAAIKIIGIFKQISGGRAILPDKTSDSDKLIDDIDAFPKLISRGDNFTNLILVKEHLRELFNVLKVAAPEVSTKYILPLYMYTQKACFDNALNSVI